MVKHRIIKSTDIAKAIKQLVFKSNFGMPEGAVPLFTIMKNTEKSLLAQTTMGILLENIDIASKERLPLCQDCGIVIVFMEYGNRILFEGEVNKAIQSGVMYAIDEYHLRKSVVSDPLRRECINTNAPAIIHTELNDSNQCKLTVYLKGGGSENMSSLLFFKPTDTTNTILDGIEKAVITAGSNPCPPLFLGVGIGGTADVALLNSKKAVLRGIGTINQDPFYQNFEKQIKERLNKLNIGPLGFGGENTIAEVYILSAPTHIATLPVAINMNCHSLRYWSVLL